MKHRNLFIVIILLLFITTDCVSQNKKENNAYRNLSLEECYEKNLTDSTLMTGWYYILDSDSGFVRQWDKTGEFYTINPFPIITAEDMIKLSIEKDKNGEYLLIKFGKEGTELWRTATREWVGGKFALIINDKLLCTPQVHSEITAGVSVLGRIDYSQEEYEKIKQTIESNKKEMQKPN